MVITSSFCQELGPFKNKKIKKVHDKYNLSTRNAETNPNVNLYSAEIILVSDRGELSYRD